MLSVTEVANLPVPVPVSAAVPAVARIGPVVPVRLAGSSSPGTNLTDLAKPVYQVLQAGAGLPPSSSPSFVLPPGGQGFAQLYNALQAIAVEHVYPAPVFSFTA